MIITKYFKRLPQVSINVLSLYVKLIVFSVLSVFNYYRFVSTKFVSSLCIKISRFYLFSYGLNFFLEAILVTFIGAIF